MTGSFPMRTVWEALETQGWDPRGREYDFYANCPAHGGDSHKLHICEGGDGRVLLKCFSHECSAKDICESIGLGLRDLFPPGHRDSKKIDRPELLRQPRGITARIRDFLSMLDEVKEPWVVSITGFTCPFCGGDGAWLRARSGGELHGECSEGCSETGMIQALTGRVALMIEDEISPRRQSGNRAI